MGQLKTETRDLSLTKGELNTLRKAGKIPAVVFGKELKKSLPIFVDQNDFMKIYHDTGKIMEMTIDGTAQMVNAKEIDLAPLGHFVHINFHQLRRGQKTQVKVPVHADGVAKGVKDEGGTLSLANDIIVVEGTPKNIPESVHVDVTSLNIGDSIHFGDIKLPEGIELIDDKELTFCTVLAPKKEEPTEVEATEVEGGADIEPTTEAPTAEASDAEKKSE